MKFNECEEYCANELGETFSGSTTGKLAQLAESLNLCTIVN